MLLRYTFFFTLFYILSSSVFAHENSDTDAFPAPHIQSAPVLQIHVELGTKIDVGETDDGHRYIVPITGGNFTGQNLSGSVIPGGADWQVNRQDNVKNIEAIYALKTDDGDTIVVHNKGIVHALNGERYAFTRPVFHVANGKYDWLNKGFFVGTIESIKFPRAVNIRIYRVE